jgi:hypothetical protein
MQAGNLFTFSALGRLVFLWLDRFTVIQTGVIAALQLLQIMPPSSSCFRSNAVYGWY